MTDIAVTLRELHRIHRNLTDLRGRLASGPRQIKVGDASIERFERELGEKKEVYKRCRMTADEKELQLKEREQRVLDIKTKLNSCSTNKEYQMFIEQIAADEQANSVLSDEILELFDKVREHESAVKESGQKVAKATEENQKLKQRVATERDSLETDIGRLEHELEKAEQELPADIRQDYDRIVKAHGEDALAPVDGETCGGCFQTLRAQMMNELALGKVVFCRACGRILYLPENTSVN